MSTSRGLFYLTFKEEFKLEPYLLRLHQESRIHFTKLRLSNLKIPVETGRWYDIQRENRICHKCNTNAVGDEFHYLFICNNVDITDIRNKFIPSYYTTHPNELR